MRDFKSWFQNMRQSINRHGHYTDFEKIYARAEKIKAEPFILNSLAEL